MSERNFQLVSQYSPAGDQAQAIEKLTKILKNKDGKAVLKGVTGSGKTYTMASIVEKIQRPTLVVTHNKTLAAQLYREFKNFFPHNAVEYFVSYYDYYQPEAYIPSTDLYIQKDSSLNDEIDRLRLRATAALLEREDVLIVSSVSCIYGLGSPEEYTHSLILIHQGDKIDRDSLIEKLVHIQYNRNDIEFARGTFRVRGDVLEIFPAYHNEALRVEFFGDEIDSIKRINPLTGRTVERLKKTAVYPAKHFITSSPMLKQAVEGISQELFERIRYFNKAGKPLEAERIEQRTMYDIEQLQVLGYCNGIENYSRHLTGRKKGERPACLLDYFPEDFLLITDESHVSVPQIGGMFNGDRARKQTLVDFGFRLPSALDNRPLNFSEFETLSKNILFVSATPGKYELEKKYEIVEQNIRPTGLLDPPIEVRPKKNQVQDLLREIKITVKQGFRVFVTTLTKKMSEDLTDYYLDLGVKVRYLHSEIETIERVELLSALRKGEFDVLVGINLLREGLDLPEVALVAILDADQEGFLRSERSLIQTAGRAARNVQGRVLFYADKITDSMKKTIDETNRRRAIQLAHNKKYNITPKSIQKKQGDILERTLESEEEKITIKLVTELREKIDFESKDRKSLIKKMKEAMKESAQNLEFEKAAILRDKIIEMEKDRDL